MIATSATIEGTVYGTIFDEKKNIFLPLAVACVEIDDTIYSGEMILQDFISSCERVGVGLEMEYPLTLRNNFNLWFDAWKRDFAKDQT